MTPKTKGTKTKIKHLKAIHIDIDDPKNEGD